VFLPDLFRIFIRKLFPPLFTIRIRGGEAIVENGKLTSVFIRDCSDIAGKSKISSGWIWGFSSDDGVRLEFSSGINGSDRQRFRNVTGVHRL
jgi:hypothetical protein